MTTHTVESQIAAAPGPAASARSRRTFAVAALGMLAIAARLALLDGTAGLSAPRSYDDGVYFAAAVQLVHGNLPYYDFLFLHPPGIVLILAPFAALTHVVSDPTALITARLAVISLGAVNTVLVARLAWPWGRAAGLSAGVLYAVLPLAASPETLTFLEPFGTTSLLLAVWLLNRTSAHPWLYVAGGILALGPLVKLWSALPAVLVLAWYLRVRGWRATRDVLIGASAFALTVIVPFAAAAPTQMWRYVVLDQLGRTGGYNGTHRLPQLFGLSTSGPGAVRGQYALAGFLITIAALAAVAAWRAHRGRLWVMLLTVQFATLVATPVFTSHYMAFIAPAYVLVLAAGATTVPARIRRPLTAAVAIPLLAATVPAYTAVGASFPAGRITAALPAHGCLRTDSPAVLLLLDRYTADLEAGCALAVDLSGQVFDVGGTAPDGTRLIRAQNTPWQHAATDYLGSGSGTVLWGLHGNGYSDATVSAITTGRQVTSFGRIVVVVPKAGAVEVLNERPQGTSPGR